jgi:hypothetical protein
MHMRQVHRRLPGEGRRRPAAALPAHVGELDAERHADQRLDEAAGTVARQPVATMQPGRPGFGCLQHHCLLRQL